jgi:similar to stage IV sporulation protein
VLKTYHYLIGYYKLRIKGWNLEKLINIAVSRGVNIWDVQRDRDGLVLNTSTYSYIQLKEISKTIDCLLEIEGKYGLPFFLARLRRRKILLVGPILFIIIIYILSSFIWSIEVNGVETIPTAEVLTAAKEAGLKVGVWKSDLELRQIERSLMTKLDKTAWVGIEIKGTKAFIKIVEKVVIPPEDPRPSHIIADKDGIITEVIVLEGKQLVKKGQTVKKGDILISGLMEDHITETSEEENYLIPRQRMVKAKGIIKARVWYEAYAESPLIKYTEQRTGKELKITGLKIGDKLIITQHKKEVPFRYFQKEEYVKRITFWRNLNLPVEAIITTYYEVNRIPEQIERDTALLDAKNLALNIVREQISQEAKIIEQKYTEILTSDPNLVRVRLLVEVEEELGQSVPIEEQGQDLSY